MRFVAQQDGQTKELKAKEGTESEIEGVGEREGEMASYRSPTGAAGAAAGLEAGCIEAQGNADCSKVCTKIRRISA